LGLAIPSFFYDSDDGVDATFGERFRAWWDGYELAARTSGARDAAADAEMPNVNEDLRSMRPPGAKPISAPRELWSAPRRRIAQMIWGDGFTLPGGEDYVRTLVNAFALSPADSALEFGSGMGGGTAAIVGRFGAYMTCFERDAALREEARGRMITLGVDDKVNIEVMGDRLPDLRHNFFLGALVREVLSTTEDKEDFLFKIIQALKSEGQLVVTDLVFDPDAASAELEAWLDVEPETHFPATVDDVRKILVQNKMVVRTASDDSADYRAMAIAGWLHLLSRIGSGIDPVLADAVVVEAERWVRRIAAIDAGALHYYRFVGVKNG